MVKISINNRYKKGFSLFEAFVVMLIVSIFVVLMANTVAHRPKAKVASEAHGRFECYYENGKLYQQLYTEGKSAGREEIKVKNFPINKNTELACEFTPPAYAKYLIIDAVGGGAGGGYDSGGSEGQFVSTFYSTVERKYYIRPGAGGKGQTVESCSGDTCAKNGSPTLVDAVNDKAGGSETTTLVSAAGGKAALSIENTTVSDILACSITEWCTQESFDCHITPTCEIKDGKVMVSFCRSKGTYATVPLTYKANKKHSDEVEMGNPRYIVNNVYTQRKDKITKDKADSNVWVYHDISQFSDYNTIDLDPTLSYKKVRPDWTPNVNDIYVPSMYTLELLMNTRGDGAEASDSNLHRLIQSMNNGSKMGDAHVGQGGTKQKSGKAGGVLFLW